jgi:hypothetical protein
MSMLPYPINRESPSVLHCFDDVPELTRLWNPEMAPQAIITKIIGHTGGAPLAAKLTAGATIVGWATSTPRVTNTMAMMSW